jgi:hypothetical protein
VDPRDSPYAPGAGTKPELLAGRAQELERFSVLVDRLARGRSTEALLFAGSRGMGKTVLLRACHERARAAGWFAAFEEVDAQLPLRQVMALNAHDVLLEMSSSRRYGERIRRALGVLKAFTSIGVLGVTLKIDVDLIPGTADSGIFKRDLLALFKELGQLAASDGSGVVFLLDELHTLRETEEMAGLDAVMHGMAQAGLPVTAVGAGVFRGQGYRDPEDTQTPSSYAGRLYRVVRLRPLAQETAHAVLTEPAGELGVTYDNAALRLAAGFAGGFPFFLQLIGEEAWEGAAESRITEADVRAAIPRAQARLDENFYPRLIGRIASEPDARDVLSGLVELGGVAVARDDLAQRTQLPFDVLREILNHLLGRDIIDVAARAYRYSFTVPGTSGYLRRVGIAPEETSPNRRGAASDSANLSP